MAEKKELNLEESEKVSGGMPNPMSMTPEELEEWQKNHKPDSKPTKVLERDENGNWIEKEMPAIQVLGSSAK